MTALRVWLSRLGELFRRRRRDRQLRDEIQSHLDHLTDDYLRQGLSPQAARTAAQRSFGSVAAMKDIHRHQRGLPFIDALGQDARFGARVLLRQRGFAGTAILTLAVGIGLVTTFFTLINAICLRGLPVDDPDSLVFVSTIDSSGAPDGLSFRDYVEVSRAGAGVQAFAAYADAPMVIVDAEVPADRVPGTYISTGAFALLGRPPVVGREFTAADEVPGAPRVALLGDAVWASRYARDPAAIGREVEIDGQPTTIVGIVPEGFRFPAQTGIWQPLLAMPGLAAAPRGARRLAVFGRLTADASFADAQAGLDLVSADLARRDPDSNGDVRLLATPFNDRFKGNINDPAWLAFMSAGVLVLLAACINVANLLVMRSAARARELAVRASIGASRGRLVRQLLIECAVLTAAGGALGVALAAGALELLSASVPAAAPLPFWITFTMDGRVLMVVLAAAAFTVLASGLLPAWQASHRGVIQALRASGVGAASARGRRLSSGLLALQVGLSIVLLTQLALAVGGTLRWRAERVVDPARLLTGTMTLPADRYDTPDARARFDEAVAERLDALAGVEAVTIASHQPFARGLPGTLAIDGPAPSTGVEWPPVDLHLIGEDYFDALDLTMLRGRGFEPTDGTPGFDIVIVNARLVDDHFGGEDPIGRRVRLTPQDADGVEAPWLTIVGVAPTIREWSTETGRPTAYLPLRADAPSSSLLLVRTTRNPDDLAAAVREAVRTIDPALPITRVMSLAQFLHDASWNGRISASILSAATTIVFGLALVGLSAVTAHRVLQRTAELGLRLAIGASRAHVVRLVLRDVLGRVAVGVGTGILLVVALSRVFPPPAAPAEAGLSVPLAFTTVLVAVASVSLLTCLGPALRAARIDPTRALRRE
jgi:predicted permease